MVELYKEELVEHLFKMNMCDALLENKTCS